MLDQSKLLDINPQLGFRNDIYQDISNPFRDSTLSNYIRIAVADVFLAAKDKSLYSIDIESLCTTNELRKELNPSAFNFLQALNLQDIDHALELSEDFGGVAHYLADKVNTLDAVKIDPDRSRLAVTRCLDKPNICHICEDLEKLEFPQAHYDLIVIGRLESLNLTIQSQQDLLTRLQASLTDRGVIVINARNRNRISKWMDSRDGSSSASIPFQDLYHSSLDLEVDKVQLSKMLADASYPAVDLYASFSSGQRCQNLFSEDYLDSSPHAVNHFYRLGGIRNEQVNEYLLLKKLIADNTRVFDLASRFVAIGGSGHKHTRQVYNYDFAHFAGTGRKAKWRTFTRCARSGSAVLKSPLHPHLESPTEGDSSAEIIPMIKQDLNPQPFHQGPLLIDDWLHAISQDDYIGLQALVTEYCDWLADRNLHEDLATCSYDLLPFNIIVTKDKGARSYLTIDPEWEICGEISAEFVLFRALFWFAFQNKTLFQGLAKQHGLATIGTFVVLNMPGISQLSELQKFIDLEEQIQSQIGSNFRAKSVEHALLQSFDSESVIQETVYTCQTAWADNSGVTDEENSRHQDWQPAAGDQTIHFSLPDFNAEKTILRVDPFTGKSLFGFLSITLTDADGIVLWQLNSMSAINEFALVVNAEAVTIENDVTCFATLNNDPHFLFDLSQVDNVADSCFAVVELGVLNDVNYNATLNTLSTALDQQNMSLISMSNTVNESLANQHYLEIRLDEVIEQRVHLAATLNNKHTHVSQLEEEIARLSDSNNHLSALLAARASVRVKAFVRRLVQRTPNSSSDSNVK